MPKWQRGKERKWGRRLWRSGNGRDSDGLKHINKNFHMIFNSTRFAKIKSWDQQNFGVINLL